MMNERQIKKMVGKMSQLFSMTSAIMPRRFNMIKLTKTKLLASLILAILFSLTCADSASTIEPLNCSNPVGNGEYTFTYKKQGCFVIGAIESHKLISGTLPDGLDFDITDGQLLLQGAPTKVTLNEAKTQIASVPLEIEVTNNAGTSMASISVTVNPIFVEGDISPSIVHVVTDASVDHTHRVAANSLSHTHDSGNPVSTEIYSATNMPFASGGTGAYNDPILIGIKEGATSFSVVLDFNGVKIPGTPENFASLKSADKVFAIQFLNVPVRATPVITHPRFLTEYIKELNAEKTAEIFFFATPFISISSPVRFITANNAGESQGRSLRNMSNSPASPFQKGDVLIFKILSRDPSLATQQTLDGQFRFSLTF